MQDNQSCGDLVGFVGSQHCPVQIEASDEQSSCYFFGLSE